MFIETWNSTTEIWKTKFINSVVQIIKFLKPMKVQCYEGQQYVACILTS